MLSFSQVRKLRFYKDKEAGFFSRDLRYTACHQLIKIYSGNNNQKSIERCVKSDLHTLKCLAIQCLDEQRSRSLLCHLAENDPNNIIRERAVEKLDNEACQEFFVRLAPLWIKIGNDDMLRLLLKKIDKANRAVIDAIDNEVRKRAQDEKMSRERLAREISDSWGPRSYDTVAWEERQR